MNLRRLHIAFSVFCIFLLAEARAQSAGFNMVDLGGQPISAGCIPDMVIRFIDTSTGVTYSNADSGGTYNSHLWDFGDGGNTSNVRNPVYGYFTPGTYTITLTVQAGNGGPTSTTSQTITVHPVPTVDMIATPSTGCNPLSVCFSDNSSSSVPITRWFWDFGGGDYDVSANPCRNFAIRGQQNCFGFTLLVEDSNGCEAVRTFTNAVCIDPLPVAGFTIPNTQLCDSPFVATFVNTSQTVHPPLLYKWYFGDNDSSTLENPTHTYDTTGNFQVTLKVTDPVCNITNTITKSITATEIHADFNYTRDVFCEGECTTFVDSSTGTNPGSFIYRWTITHSSGAPVYTSAQKDFNVCPTAPGTYNAQLIVLDGSCSDTMIVPAAFIVNPKPTAAAAFTATPTTSCSAPLTVQFTVPTPCTPCTYTWLFGDGTPVPYVGLDPSHTYTETGSFSPTLEVTNNFGCSAVQIRGGLIRIDEIDFDFEMTDNRICAPDTVWFTDITVTDPPDTVVGWVWDFSDTQNGTSNLQNPFHVFTTAGKYAVTMSAVTVSGCAGMVTDTVYVGEYLTPDFDMDPNPVCVNEPVSFTNTTDETGIFIPPGDSIYYFWDFAGGGTSTLKDPPQKIYDEPDTLFIKLAAGILGCLDTIEKQLIILHPLADFEYEQDCINPAMVAFSDSSEEADTWTWLFGDTMPSGVEYSDTVQHPTHTYDTSGNYNVTLIVTNDETGCKDSFIRTITVSILDVDFTVDKRNVCIGETVTLTNTSEGILSFFRWDFNNGEGFATTKDATYTPSTEGLKDIKLVVTDILGCTDSVILNDWINVGGVTADFTTNPGSGMGCIPPSGTGNTVNFTSSTSFLGSPQQNLTYLWNFGVDPPATSALQHPTFTYTAAGTYAVTLTVESDSGCIATVTKSITMRDPVACFNTAGVAFCPGQPVTVSNCTQGGGTFTWNFGGPDEVGVNPTHVYSTPGTYTITMHVQDAGGCRDTALPITITIVDPDLDIRVDNDTSYCPPHIACFDTIFDISGLPIDRLRWYFGDGDSSDFMKPCHIYTRPGNYNVTLKVWFVNLCVESVTKSTFIRIGGASGDIAIDPDTGCVPMNIVLDANSQGAASLFWRFPDDQTGRLAGDTVHHTIYNPGTWTYFVYITDTQTPVPCTYILPADTIVAADSVIADFTFSDDSVCRADPIQFTDMSSTVANIPIISWRWDFDGVIKTEQHPVHAFTTRGWHTVTLTVESETDGCSGTISQDVYVLDKPTAAFMVSQISGCDTLQVTFTDQSSAGLDGGIDPDDGWYWDFGDTNSSTDFDTTRIPLPYEYNQPGIYNPYLVVTDVNGCDDTATIPISVYKTPDGILLPSTVQICQKDTIQLFTDSSATYDSYLWTPGDYLSDPTAQHPLAFPPVSTTYVVSITEGHGCDMTDTINITVIPLPPLTVTPHPSIAICLGDTTQLTAAGALGYSWVFANSPAQFITATNIANPRVFPPVTVDYIVIGDGVSGCKARDTVRVVVTAPDAQFIGERNCLGDSTNYLDFSTGSVLDIVSWEWNFGTGSGSSNIKNPAYTYAVADTYAVQLIVTDEAGCKDTATDFTIIDAPPDAEAGTDGVLCYGDSIQLSATGGSVFIWSPGPYIVDPASANPVVFPKENTTYIVNVTNGVCPYDTAEVVIEVQPLPTVKTIEDTYIVRGEIIKLETEASTINRVIWTPADSLSCSDCLSPFASPYIRTTYVVKVIDEFGCASTDKVTIDADVECKDEQVFVPNAFTPNGDGVNDRLILRVRGIEKVNFYRVFDRWGKLVYETKEFNEATQTGWDGKNEQGQNLSGAVYVYVVDAVCFYGKSIVKTGNVTLIK